MLCRIPRLSPKHIVRSTMAFFVCWCSALLATAAGAQSLFEETYDYLDREEREALYSDSLILRSRLALLDGGKLERAEQLVLNLFSDVELRVRVSDRREIRDGGSFVYGSLEDGGYASLYTSSEGIVRGNVSSVRGTFSIRSRKSRVSSSDNGELQVVISEVDAAKVHLHGDDRIEAPLPSADHPFLREVPSAHAAEAGGKEEADELTVLALFTPKAEEQEGGMAEIEATISAEAEKMNQALINSGIGGRSIATKIKKVDYEETGGPLGDDLVLLAKEKGHDDDPEGVLDEVHTLREQYAADLVNLFVVKPTNGGCGIAYSFGRSQRQWAERNCASRADKQSCLDMLIERAWRGNGFGVTAVGEGCYAVDAFQHELGHNLGLMHDRYQEGDDLSLDDPARFPNRAYGFGYVNQDFTRPKCRRTIMAYRDQCEDQGFTEYSSRVSELRFSNPEVNFDNGLDPSGVEGEELTTALDGPVNAAMAIDDAWETVASLFRGCPYVTVFPNFPSSLSFSALGETRTVRFSPGGTIPNACTGADLDFTVSAAEDFVLTSAISKAGTGTDSEYTLTIEVEKNDRCESRSHTSEVRNQSTKALVGRILISQSGLKLCDLIDEVTNPAGMVVSLDFSARGIYRVLGTLFEDFTGLTRLNLSENNIVSLSSYSFVTVELLESLDDSLSKRDQINLIEQDLSINRGLVNLESLDLSHNELGLLEPAAFFGLANLKDLDLSHNRLGDLPANSFSDLISLSKLNASHNQLVTFSANMFSVDNLLSELNLSNNRIANLPADSFSRLSQLRDLDLSFNATAELPAGVFSSLSSLEYLWLDHNAITSLTSGTFSAVGNLRALSLDKNRLNNVVTSAFSNLSQLQYFWLSLDEMTSIPSGLFGGLGQLRYLNLSVNGAVSLPSNLFAGLSNLEYLHLSGKALTSLTSQLCRFISSIENVKTRGFDIESLCENSGQLHAQRSNDRRQKAHLRFDFAHVNAPGVSAQELANTRWGAQGLSWNLILKLGEDDTLSN